MDFFSKFTKPAEQSKPAASEGTTEPNDDLFGSAKVMAGAAQSYFSHQPPTYENAEVAGATADILGAASEYGKLDKTQGVGKYVDQAESYLKEYESSNTTAPAPADAGVKSEKADAAVTKGADASTEEPTKLPEPYGEEPAADYSSKPSVGGDAAAETDTGDDNTKFGGKYGEIPEDGLKTEVTDIYEQQPKVDKYEESTEEEIPKKPAAPASDASEDYENEGISMKPLTGGQVAEVDSGDLGYAKDTEEGVPKPSAGGDDASKNVRPAEGGFGDFTKVAGDFLSK